MIATDPRGTVIVPRMLINSVNFIHGVKGRYACEADAVADVLELMDGEHYRPMPGARHQVYRCPLCRLWHHGRQQDSRRQRYQNVWAARWLERNPVIAELILEEADKIHTRHAYARTLGKALTARLLGLAELGIYLTQVPTDYHAGVDVSGTHMGTLVHGGERTPPPN